MSGWTLTTHVGLNRDFDVYDDTLPGDGERIAEDTVDAAVPWVAERVERGERFFLFLHFFDLRADPGEQTNVAYERWPETRRMSLEIDGFLHGTERERIARPEELAPDVQAGLRALGYIE